MEDYVKVKTRRIRDSSSDSNDMPRSQSLKKRISKNVLKALGRQLQESSLNLESSPSSPPPPLPKTQVSESVKRALRDQLKESQRKEEEEEEEIAVLQHHNSRTSSMDSDTLLETQRMQQNSVYINDRVIHATGVQGSYVLRMSKTEPPAPKRKFSAFTSLFRRTRKNTPSTTPSPHPPTLHSSKSISGGLSADESITSPTNQRVRSLQRTGQNAKSVSMMQVESGHKKGTVRTKFNSQDSKSSLFSVPSDARAPFAFWREKCEKSRNQPANLTLRKILTTVTRVINRVVHSVHTVPYIPPAAKKGNVYAPFELVSAEEFSLITAACTAILDQNDRALIRVEAPCKIFGDIHGQIFDLVQFFRQYGSPSHHVGDMNLCNYVFAGDFVDRGAYSLEVLTVLMCLKIRYHPHVVMLRGNHEDDWANERYGFHKEIKERLHDAMSDEEIKDLKHHILALFQRLPLAAVIGERILCVRMVECVLCFSIVLLIDYYIYTHIHTYM